MGKIQGGELAHGLFRALRTIKYDKRSFDTEAEMFDSPAFVMFKKSGYNLAACQAMRVSLILLV